jgi:hypothetical protein
LILELWIEFVAEKITLAPFLIRKKSRNEIRRRRRKQMAHIDRVAKARLNSISSGKLLRLRGGVYRQLWEREWIFNRTENHWVFLIHKEGAYGVVVRIEDIEWSEC